MGRTPTLRPRLLRTTNLGHTVTTRVLRKAPERPSIVTPKTPAGDLACPDVFTASVANACSSQAKRDNKIGFNSFNRGKGSAKEREEERERERKRKIINVGEEAGVRAKKTIQSWIT